MSASIAVYLLLTCVLGVAIGYAIVRFVKGWLLHRWWKLRFDKELERLEREQQMSDRK
jgi:uncharacterized membrane-anchored protein YhcB (DUF1043 family)